MPLRAFARARLEREWSVDYFAGPPPFLLRAPMPQAENSGAAPVETTAATTA